MAEDSLKFLLQTVRDMLVDHYHLVSGAENEFKLLEGEVSSMSAFLQELEKSSVRGALLKQYESEVRNVSHEAHDIIDECLTRAALEKSRRLLIRFFNPKFTSLANHVKSFRQGTVRPIFEKYGIGKITSADPQISNSITTIPNDDIVQITSPGEENIIGPEGEPSTANEIFNGELEHENTLPTEEKMVGPEGERSTSKQFVNEELEHENTLPTEEKIVGPEGEASTSKQFVNEELEHENTLQTEEKIGPEAEASTSKQFVNEELENEISLRRGMVVGFKEEVDTIIEYLTKESKQLEAMSIIGMPGLGKTTLARKIYDDKRIKKHFSKVIWVDISQNYEKRKVFQSILESLTEEDTSSLADDKLAPTIKVYLQSEKFLLVLDDVWNVNDWEVMEGALPKDNNLGKVLITSRQTSVAKKANFSSSGCYMLGNLGKEKSWKLLQLQVFDNLNICPPDLDPFGKIIAHGCGGVPLAIVVIGGILLKICSTSTGVNETKSQWEKVSKNVCKYFDNEENLTRNLISLSINELSHDLKYCFLYLGIFPEESQIPVRRLFRMWIAEGFIQRKPNKSLEEVAEENLKDLIDRNLVMVDNMKPDGYIKTCRVHDLIREFCKIEASLENHNLFHEMEMSRDEGTFCLPVSQINNRRRICIHSHIEDFLKEQPKGPRVHSFLCFAKDEVSALPAETPPIPVDFNRLRVLDVNPIKLTKFPSKLTELIHLRYIALSGDGDDFRVLPKQILNLWNLQSITIETKLQTFEIKANVWKMMHLRHLKSKAAIVLEEKLKGTAGKELQSLSRLSAQCCTEGVFKRAKNLKNLGIRGDLASILEVSCLTELHLLKKLKLVYDVSPKVASEKPLPGLPNADRFPPNLKILQLSGTFLPWNKIRTLENLPVLEELRLKKKAFEGKYWAADDCCFRSLEILVITDNRLVVWTAKESSFPKLKCLVLKDCKELEQIPFQLKENLHILHVERVSESAVESAKKIAEEKQKAEGGFQLITGSAGK